VLRTDPDAMTDCTGTSCSLAGSQDGSHTCQAQEGGTAGTQPTTEPGESIDEPIGPYDCVECSANGNACEGIGSNSSCCGGYCRVTMNRESQGFWEDLRGRLANDFGGLMGQMYLMIRDADGVCGRGAEGDFCYVNQTCRSGKCIKDADDSWTQRGGICSHGGPGSVCDSTSDCTGDMACIGNTCIPKVIGSYCDDDDDCASGHECETSGHFCWRPGAAASGGGTVSTPTCTSANNNEICKRNYGDDYMCMSRIGGRDGYKRCTNGAPGSTCIEDAQCQINGQTNHKCMLNGVDGAGGVGMCVNKEEGAGCDYGGSGGSGGSSSEGSAAGSAESEDPCSSESSIYCVQLTTVESRGTYWRPGTTNQPCQTGICGAQGTCAPEHTCVEESGTCVPNVSGD
jgi:hypothetical protein